MIHAAGYSSNGKLPHGTYAVALSCRDEAELKELCDRLQEGGIQFARIYEPDPPYNGQLMALGLFPSYKSTFRRFLSNLPLIK